MRPPNPEAPFDGLNDHWEPPPKSRWWWVWLAALVLLVALCIAAFAHDAPSGWHYPAACCSPDDTAQLCHPVDCDEISEGDDGSYKWEGLTFSKDKAYPTQDGTCHACNSWQMLGNQKWPDHPYCIFVRQGS